MALYVKDPEIDRMAERLSRLSRVSKTEAVRTALKDAIERKRARKTSILKAIRKAQASAAAMGVRPGSDFDMKEFMDELSGGI